MLLEVVGIQSQVILLAYLIALPRAMTFTQVLPRPYHDIGKMDHLQLKVRPHEEMVTTLMICFTAIKVE